MIRRTKLALLTMWGVVKNVALDPAQRLVNGQLVDRLQQLDLAFLRQLVANMTAFAVASFLLSWLSPLAPMVNLTIACLLGYSPEWWAMWQAKQQPRFMDALRWTFGVMFYIAAKAVLNQHWPVGAWPTTAAGEWLPVTLWRYLENNILLLLLHFGVASGLSYVGELFPAWFSLRLQLLHKKRQKS